jgi:tetratricopeptide (TPR) repeat protein
LLELLPAAEEALYFKSQIQAQRGQLHEAFETAAEGKRRGSETMKQIWNLFRGKSKGSWEEQAAHAGATGNWRRMLKAAESGLAESRDNVKLLFYRAVALGGLGNHEGELRAYIEVLKRDPNQEESLTNAAVEFRRRGDVDKALEMYNRLLMLRPDDVRILLNKGVALSSAGRYQEEVEICDEILKRDANNFDAWKNKAASLMDLRRFGEARACYERALKLAPNDPQLIAAKRMAAQAQQAEKAMKPKQSGRKR